MKPAVAYLRVSTKQQGASGLGLDAQRETVRAFVERDGYRLVNGREFVEVESGSKDNRPELQRASATFKLAEALIKADKQFDMLILPSQRHGYRGEHSKYFRKTRWNYFVKHLRGVEPIWDFKWE